MITIETVMEYMAPDRDPIINKMEKFVSCIINDQALITVLPKDLEQKAAWYTFGYYNLVPHPNNDEPFNQKLDYKQIGPLQAYFESFISNDVTILEKLFEENDLLELLREIVWIQYF